MCIILITFYYLKFQNVETCFLLVYVYCRTCVFLLSFFFLTNAHFSFTNTF